MPLRILAVALVCVLAGCGGTRAFQPSDPLDEPTAYVVFDLPDEYEVLDIRYDSGLVGDSLSKSATVQVFARRRDTGQEALLVYDPRRLQQGPMTVIELRRTPQPEASAR